MFSIIMLLAGNVIDRNAPFSREAMGVFFKSLDIMWKSMAGIFAVIIVFYIIIVLLGRVGRGNE